jgi:hypothetical protein
MRNGTALLKCHRSDLVYRPGDGIRSERPVLEPPEPGFFSVSGLRPLPPCRRQSSCRRPACGADSEAEIRRYAFGEINLDIGFPCPVAQAG